MRTPRPLYTITILASLAPAAVLAQGSEPPASTGSGAGAELPWGTLTDPGGYPFRSLAASPLEPVHRLAFVHVSRGSRDRWVALADLGDRLSFWIHRRPENEFELAGAVAAGAFSRFDLESTQNEFVEIHFRVGFQIRARYRGVAARLELYHASSHLGDEFLLGSGLEPIDVSRETLELLLQTAPLPWLLVYGGGGVIVRSSDPLRRPSARAGLELTSAPRPRTRLYLFAEAAGWAEQDWEPMVSAEAGVALGEHSRLGILFGTGPSRAEQFFLETETLIGFGFSFRR
jgi:hypothetical protein